jgi:hypothetical protein
MGFFALHDFSICILNAPSSDQCPDLPSPPGTSTAVGTGQQIQVGLDAALQIRYCMYNLTTLPTHNTAKLTLHSDTDDTIPTLQQIPELLKELPCTLQAHARPVPTSSQLRPFSPDRLPSTKSCSKLLPGRGCIRAPSRPSRVLN